MFLKLKKFWYSHQEYTLKDLHQMFLTERGQTDKYEFIDILKILKNTDISSLKSYFNDDLGSLFFIYLVGGGYLRQREAAWIYGQNETLSDPRYRPLSKISPFFFESFNKKQVDIFIFLFNHVSEQLNTPYLEKLLKTLDQDKSYTGSERQFVQYVVNRIVEGCMKSRKQNDAYWSGLNDLIKSTPEYRAKTYHLTGTVQ